MNFGSPYRSPSASKEKIDDAKKSISVSSSAFFSTLPFLDFCTCSFIKEAEEEEEVAGIKWEDFNREDLLLLVLLVKFEFNGKFEDDVLELFSLSRSS